MGYNWNKYGKPGAKSSAQTPTLMAPLKRRTLGQRVTAALPTMLADLVKQMGRSGADALGIAKKTIEPVQDTGRDILGSLAKQTLQSASDTSTVGGRLVTGGLVGALNLTPLPQFLAAATGQKDWDVRSRGAELAKDIVGTPTIEKTPLGVSLTTKPERKPFEETAVRMLKDESVPYPLRLAAVGGLGGTSLVPEYLALSGGPALISRLLKAGQTVGESAAALSKARETLGVSKTATPDEIKTAFRQLAHEYHPDTGALPDPKRFQDTVEAYEALSGEKGFLARFLDILTGKSGRPKTEAPRLLSEPGVKAPQTPMSQPAPTRQPIAPEPVASASTPTVPPAIVSPTSPAPIAGGPLVPVSGAQKVAGEAAKAIQTRNKLLEAQNEALGAFQTQARGESIETPRYEPGGQVEPKQLKPGVTIPTRTPGGEVKPIRYVSRPVVLPESVEEARLIDQISRRGAVVTKDYLAKAPTFRRPVKAERQLVSVHRVVDYADPSGTLQREVIRPIDRGIEAVDREQVDLLNALKQATGRIKRNSVQDKMVFRSIESGREFNLTEQQQQLKEFAQQTYRDLLRRINASRASIGKAPVPERKDYVTHIREWTLLEQLYGDTPRIPDQELIALRFAQPNSPAFKFAKERLGGRHGESVLQALEAYFRPALRQIHLAAPVTNARAHIRFITDNEPLNTYLTDYVNEAVLSRPTKLDTAIEQLPLASFLMRATDWLVTKTGAGVILGNISSMLSNLGGQVQALADLGPKYYALGLNRSLDQTWRRFAIDNSHVVFNRYKGEIDVGFNPFQKGSGLVKRGLGFLFRQIEIENVMVSWLGGYQRALERTMGGFDAIEYANKTALKTQGGYSPHQAPAIFRNKSLRAFNQFTLAAQNFYLQLGYDPIRLKHEPGATTKALRLLIFSLLADSAYRKVRGYGLFFDNPLARRGVPAAYRLAEGGAQWLTGKLTENPELQKSGRTNIEKGAVTLVPGGGQAQKTWQGIEAIERGYATDTAGRRKFDLLTTGDKVRVLLFGTGGFPAADRQKLDLFDTYQRRFAIARDSIVRDLVDGDLEKARERIEDTSKEMNVPEAVIVDSLVSALTTQLENIESTTVLRKFKTLPRPVKVQVVQELLKLKQR